MKVYNEIKIEPTNSNKTPEQKAIEHEIICLTNSWRPSKADKERVQELSRRLKEIKREKAQELKEQKRLEKEQKKQNI